jgi:hypothetical protein
MAIGVGSWIDYSPPDPVLATNRHEPRGREYECGAALSFTSAFDRRQFYSGKAESLSLTTGGLRAPGGRAWAQT